MTTMLINTKLENFSLIRDHRKSRETREIAYTCRYTSGDLISARLSAGVGKLPCFLTFSSVINHT